ncbi:MAG: RNA-binding protein [Candidatus Colwellbacteria bacterium]|nr:RNA-binding protein [Candidatus Colwellbacteria bacterium]
MTKRLYVGGIPYSTTDSDLQAFFEKFGTVIKAEVIKDRMTNRSKGFGFVEVNEADAEQMIAASNGADLGGRPLTVNEARPRVERGDFGRNDSRSNWRQAA